MLLYMISLSRVHNISSPFRHNRKPLIFQWALTLRNAGIGLGSIPAFRPIEKLTASSCDETETIYYEPGFNFLLSAYATRSLLYHSSLSHLNILSFIHFFKTIIFCAETFDILLQISFHHPKACEISLKVLREMLHLGVGKLTIYIGTL